jgi:hypothetical protein
MRSHHPVRPTSLAARGSIERHLTSLRGKVYRAVLRSGSRGLTREQIERKTGLSGNCARPRCVELISLRLLVPSGELRCTKSGRKAEVLIARNTK